MTNEWNLVSVIRPETHKDVLFSDGEKFFDGFLGCDKTVYRTNKPRLSEDNK